LAQEEVKPDLASLVAEIAREECKKLHEKRLKGLFGRENLHHEKLKLKARRRRT